MIQYFMFCLMLLALLALTASADEPAPAAAPNYSDIHAIFARACLGCHNSKELKGELNMESHALLLKGGENGPVIVPGKSGESPLVDSILHKKKPFMPPPKKGEKLKPEEIRVIRAWIDAGAPPPAPGEEPPVAAVPAIPKIDPKVPPRRGIFALAYDPAAKRVAAGRPGGVELRPAGPGEPVRRLEGHAGNVNAVAFSAAGGFLAAGGGEPGVGGEIVLWKADDGARLRTLKGHADAVCAVAVSPDGKLVASGAYDGRIVLWDVATGDALHELKGHNEAVYGLAFRPDGRVLASASADRTVKLWDAATGERLDTLIEPAKGQMAAAFSPDGKRLAAAGADGRVRLWTVSEAAREGTNPIATTVVAHEGTILRLAFSPDGATIVTAADDRTVKLWNASDISPKSAAIEAQPDWPAGVAFVHDGRAVAVGRLDGSFALYDASTGKPWAPPKPEVSAVLLRGVARGTTSRLVVTGAGLDWIQSVKLEAPGLTARLPSPGGASNRLEVEVVAAADAALGAFPLTLHGPGGATPAVQIHVDTIPQMAEAEPNDDPGAATDTPLPAAVWGALGKGGDADGFRFEAKAGRTIVLDAAAKRIGSKAEIVLAVSDAAGRVLETSAADGREADALIAFTPPADGTYVARVTDLQLASSPEHFYRLSAGELPLVTDCFPLAVPAKAETPVRLIGYNLPADATAVVKAGEGGDATVPVDPARFRARRPLAVRVVPAAEPEEAEPNDAPERANSIHIPARPEPGAGEAAPGRGGAVHGRIGASGDADLYAFESEAGKAWVIETEAARRGSPADTRIEVLTADGKPVPRVQLRAVRDSYLTFRGIDANTLEARLAHYEEIGLTQFIYWRGEVNRLHRHPRGPDSGFAMYSVGGARRTYYDSTSVSHALEETVYVVEAHPPGTTHPANGLPTFTLNYANDDDARRKLGSDSRLHFTAPAKGTYLVKVADARDGGGERHVYRLEIRESRPDFAVAIEGFNASPPPGGGFGFTVRVDRIDEFEGPVRVDITGAPPGYVVSTPIVVETGHLEAQGAFCALPDAVKPADEAASGMKAVATAVLGGAETTRPVPGIGKIGLGGEKPKIRVWIEPWSEGQEKAPPPSPPGVVPEIAVSPGTLTPAWLRIEREGFNEPVNFELENPPHGVFVADIGLNGVLIPPGETERKIFLKCEGWVAPAERLCHARATQTGGTSPPVRVRVAEGGRKP